MAEDHTAGDAEERPVREQFKKASIGGSQKDTKLAHEAVQEQNSETVSEDAIAEDAPCTVDSQPQKPVADTPAPVTRHPTRKRSRDITSEEDALNNGQRKASGERARDSIDEIHKTDEANGTASNRPGTPNAEGDDTEPVASPKIKRSRVHSSTTENGTITSDTTAAKIPPTSGFANASTASPFSTLAGNKSPSTEATGSSASAFAASGFGALAGSTTSGFGAIGKPSGGFGSGGSFASSTKPDENEKPKEASASTFGGSLGQKSAFAAAPATTGGFGSASSASGFGKLGAGSGFGSAGGFGGLGGGGLTSFASGKPSASLAPAAKPAKPFGASKDEEEEENEEDGDDAGYKSPLSQDAEEKQDERFYVQEVETGEEGEDTVFQARCKLYNFAADADGKKEWRERGLGALRLNVSRKEGSDAKPSARFLMRAEGSHRVVLNTPIKKDLKYGSPTGGPPTGSFVYFMGTIGESGLEPLQIKMRAQFALELHEKITDLQASM